MSKKELSPLEFKPKQEISKQLLQSSASKNLDAIRLLHIFKSDEDLSNMEESCPKY